MTSFLTFFLLPFIFLPNILHAQTTDYDYFLLVHQWPATFCILNPCNKLPPVKHFIIHGMWPARHDGVHVDGDPSKKFNNQTLKDPALKDLGVYWPSLTNGSSNMDFWKYEWEKHGSRSANVLNQTQYFSSSLNLYRKLNLTHSLLSSGGITPGNRSHSLGNIKNKIIGGSTFVPIIQCVNRNGTSLLYQIMFCICSSGKENTHCKYSTTCKSNVLLPYPQ